jgi:hypothetical protein
MSWVIVTVPIMLLTIAIAVLPVLVISIRDARHFGSTDARPRRATATDLGNGYSGALAGKDEPHSRVGEDRSVSKLAA